MPRTKTNSIRVIRFHTTKWSGFLLFDSPQQYNNMHKAIFESNVMDPNAVVDYEGHGSRGVFQANTINAFFYDESNIQKEKNNNRTLQIHMLSGTIYNLSIHGYKRANYNYEILKHLVNKPPTQRFLEISQEDNKTALLRHHDTIVSLVLIDSEVDEWEKI